MSPTSRTFNYRDTPIEVEFSLPVKPETVPPAFSVSPPMEGTFSWLAPNKFIFTPKKLWAHGMTVLVTLESGITDTYGFEHLEKTSWDFSTVGGYFYIRDIRPFVAAHCTSCHRSDGPAARVNLSSKPGLMPYVRVGDGENSRLLTVLKDSNHAGQLSPQAVKQLFIVRDWITEFMAAD
jgi:Big-like domain-containing protein